MIILLPPWPVLAVVISLLLLIVIMISCIWGNTCGLTAGSLAAAAATLRCFNCFTFHILQFSSISTVFKATCQKVYHRNQISKSRFRHLQYNFALLENEEDLWVSVKTMFKKLLNTGSWNFMLMFEIIFSHLNTCSVNLTVFTQNYFIDKQSWEEIILSEAFDLWPI